MSIRALPGARIGPALAGAALLGALVFALPIFVVLSGAGQEGPDAGAGEPSAGAIAEIPAEYLALYQSAGRQYGIDWAILAAMGLKESGHGQGSAPGIRSGVNAYGCCAGPMQFDITDEGGNTWAAYGLDGNGDGARNVYDPADAIPAAAHYLQVLGGDTDDPDHLREALRRYGGWPTTHNSYVDGVLATAERYRAAAPTIAGALAATAPPGAGAATGAGGDGTQPLGLGGFTFPVRSSDGLPGGSFVDDYHYPRPGGSHCTGGAGPHCATDVIAPRGTPVVAPITGTITKIGEAGLGGNRLWIEAGPDGLYLAHFSAFAPGLALGQQVRAGQLVGYVGNTGAPSATPHLHLAWRHRLSNGAEVWPNPYYLLEASRGG